MANDLIRARLVYDGGNDVFIPPEMGIPAADQMQGTPAERLCELAGRICYDSLGRGRPSFTQEVVTGADPHTGEQITKTVQGYHDHIREVGHGSVLEHFNFTLEIPVGTSNYLSNEPQFAEARMALMAWQCLNRPGIIAVPAKDPRGLRVTMNLRTVTDWMAMSQSLYGYTTPMELQLAGLFIRKANELAPHIIPLEVFVSSLKAVPGSASELYYDELSPPAVKIVEPISDNERWISLFMSGSRGLSHELVRHGDFTAISQRSTRFVDESESPWVAHPLVEEYCGAQDDSASGGIAERDYIWDENERLQKHALEAYRLIAERLEGFLSRRGIDKTSARKQARGAARGYLGNALYTELIFSANVAQWKRMLRQRASRFADAEIRELFCKALVELKRSRYGERFKEFELAPSPDGIGQVAIEAE
jgi:thymidylate synthase ThyX